MIRFGARKKKKLTLDEIEKTRDRILQEYDHYIVEYMKPAKIKDDFYRRYLDAMRARMDMDHFLFAEFTVVQDLIQQEKDKKNRERVAEESVRARKLTADQRAEQIIKENKQKIAHYPAVDLHPGANDEICKLAGVMKLVDEVYWPQIEKIMRKSSPTLYSNARIVLEQKLHDLCSTNLDGELNRLVTYVAALGRFPREYRTIEREEQRYILDVAHLLHSFCSELEAFRESESASGEDAVFVDTAYGFVETIIQDFRLGDFKPAH